MKVRDIMSRDVQVARPGDSIQNVAGRMAVPHTRHPLIPPKAGMGGL